MINSDNYQRLERLSVQKPLPKIQSLGDDCHRSQFDLIVGFDAEWVRADRFDDSLPATDNVLLSWQIVAFDARGERSVQFIRYASGSLRRSRVSLKCLLAEAVAMAIEAGFIEKLMFKGKKDKHLRIALVGHFLRADLTTLRDFSKFKSQIDSVRKSALL